MKLLKNLLLSKETLFLFFFRNNFYAFTSVKQVHMIIAIKIIWNKLTDESIRQFYEHGHNKQTLSQRSQKSHVGILLVPSLPKLTIHKNNKNNKIVFILSSDKNRKIEQLYLYIVKF